LLPLHDESLFDLVGLQDLKTDEGRDQPESAERGGALTVFRHSGAERPPTALEWQ
jgi:hypothetical protein